jgi:glycosyltransferase involved in cell wall biosynthesis
MSASPALRSLPAPAEIQGDVGISVVIPAFNERPVLAELLTELARALDATGERWEAIVVDDGSTDGTFGELRALKASRPELVAVRLRRNFGKAKALAAGFALARGGVVVTMDSDLQDDPFEIPRLLAKLEEGHDVVSGWKETRRDPWTRRLLSRGFNALVARVSGVHLRDVNCGLKAYRAEVVNRVRLYGELHRFIPVLAHAEGYRIAELAVNHRPRAVGRSRYGLERYARGLFDLVTVWFLGRYRSRPLHLFGALGAAFGLAGLAICGYLTVTKLLGAAIGHRPLLTLGVLLIVVGIQMLMTGLVAEMLTRMREEQGERRDSGDVAEIA